jgi:hypothetical protein
MAAARIEESQLCRGLRRQASWKTEKLEDIKGKVREISKWKRRWSV